MIKKVFAVAVLAMSMAMVSCGGDKAEGADSTNVEGAQVEAVTGNAEADAFIAKINACTTPEELDALGAEAKKFENDPTVMEAIMAAGQAKAAALLGGAQEVLEETETVDVEGLVPDAVEGAQDAAQSVVDAAQAKAAAVVADAQDKAAAAVADAQAKAAQAVSDAQAKAAKAMGL